MLLGATQVMYTRRSRTWCEYREWSHYIPTQICHGLMTLCLAVSRIANTKQTQWTANTVVVTSLVYVVGC